MKLSRAAQVFIVCLLAAVSGAAQQIDSGAGSAASALPSNAPTVPRLLKFSGLLTDATGKPLMGPVDVTFSIYANQHDAAPLWQETQTVQADATGQYTVLLGAMSAQGVPMELFTSGEARWLGVSAGKLPEQPRVLLVSVPYALKAGDAETLGGKPASAYLLASQDSSGTTATTSTTATSNGASGKQVTLTTATGITPNAITGTTNYIPVFTDDSGSMGNSVMYQTGGNVGIGTTTPVETLDVNGVVSSKVGKFFFKRDMTDQAGRRNWGFVTEVSKVGDFQILESTSNTSDPSVSRLTIDAGGKVGLGIAVPNYDLDLNGSFATHGGRFFFRRDLTDSPNRRNWGFLTEVVNTGDFEILESTANNTEPTIPRVAFLSGGNVGIGTTTPTATLEVNGTAKFDGAVTFGSTITGNVSTSNQLVSTVATGTAPLAVSSTTLVPHLNADMLDGFHASAFQPVGAYATLGGNAFVGNQAVTGNVSATGLVSGGSGSFTGSTSPGSIVTVTQQGSTAMPPNFTTPVAVALTGEASATTNFAVGVAGMAHSPDAFGVVGANDTTTGSPMGVIGVIQSTSGAGVVGNSNATTGDGRGMAGVTEGTSGIGVSAEADAGSGSTIGVYGRVDSPSGTAGVFNNRAGGAIIVGQNNSVNEFRVDGTGKGFFNGGTQTGGADFAESFAVAGKRARYGPGDVLVIDPLANRRVALSSQPYSTAVAGIYSTKPGVLATPYEMDDGRLTKEVPLAVVGIVPCKVTAENGPIERGDLLVTASTPGHAMKGTDRSRMLGAIVGKALEALPGGTGVIQVLVTLQ